MRLSEIYSYINALDTDSARLSFIDSTTVGNIRNFKNLISQLDIYNLDFYTSEIKTLKSSEIYTSSAEEFDFHNSTKFGNVIWLHLLGHRNDRISN